MQRLPPPQKAADAEGAKGGRYEGGPGAKNAALKAAALRLDLNAEEGEGAAHRQGTRAQTGLSVPHMPRATAPAFRQKAAGRRRRERRPPRRRPGSEECRAEGRGLSATADATAHMTTSAEEGEGAAHRQGNKSTDRIVCATNARANAPAYKPRRPPRCKWLGGAHGALQRRRTIRGDAAVVAKVVRSKRRR